MPAKTWQPGPASARVLGLVRICMGYTWLGVLAQKSDIVPYPEACWIPISLAHFLNGPPSPNFLAFNFFLAVSGALCLMLGLASRVAGPVTTVAGTTYIALGMCYGKITHTENMLILATFCMSFTNWGQACSWRADRCDEGPSSAEIKAWGLWLTTFGLSLYYAGSAFTKLRHGFLAPETMEQFLKQRILLTGNWLNPISLWLLSHPWLCIVGGWLGLLFEGGFWLGMRSTSFRAIAYCAALAFHSVLTVVGGLGFTNMKQVLLIMLMAHILLFLGERRPEVARWVFAVPSTPAGWKVQTASGLGTLILLMGATFSLRGDRFGPLVQAFGFWLGKVAKTYGNQAPALLALLAVGIACWIVWTDLKTRSGISGQRLGG